MKNKYNVEMVDRLYRLVLTIIAIWMFVGIMFPVWFNRITSVDFKEVGPIGDTFGAVNALFSGLALVFIVITLFYQTKQLNYQRDDLKVQRKQGLETTFHNMLFKMSDSLNDHEDFREIGCSNIYSAIMNEKSDNMPLLIANSFFRNGNQAIFRYFRQFEYILDYVTENLLENIEDENSFIRNNDKHAEYMVLLIPETLLPYLITYSIVRPHNNRLAGVVLQNKLSFIDDADIEDKYVELIQLHDASMALFKSKFQWVIGIHDRQADKASGSI